MAARRDSLVGDTAGGASSSIYQHVFANGPNEASLIPYTILPNDTYSKMLCNNQVWSFSGMTFNRSTHISDPSNQILLSTDFTNFNLFGLYFTYITGVLMILISYTLEPFFSFLYRTRGYKHYKFLEWSTNETLQLQRLAYQGLGRGPWSGYTDTIPKTKSDEELGNLALAYGDDEEVRGTKVNGIEEETKADTRAADRSETVTVCTPRRSISPPPTLNPYEGSAVDVVLPVSPLSPESEDVDRLRPVEPVQPVIVVQRSK